MATAVAKVSPDGVAQDLATLAAALDAEADITSAVVVPSATQVSVLRQHVLVTSTGINEGAASTAITNAITAVGNCVLLPGDETIVTAP